MALQSSGAISLANIQTEFGGSNPISLSEYYLNGSYTTSNNTNVPTSGTVSIGSFYGTVKAVQMTYEIIGAGGGGGGGLTVNTNPAYAGSAGGDSTLTYIPAGGSSTTITQMVVLVVQPLHKRAGDKVKTHTTAQVVLVVLTQTVTTRQEAIHLLLLHMALVVAVAALTPLVTVMAALVAGLVVQMVQVTPLLHGTHQPHYSGM